MTDERNIPVELAVHHARGIKGPVSPEDLVMDEDGVGPIFAEKLMDVVGNDPAKKAAAVGWMNNRIQQGIDLNPINGRNVHNLEDVREVARDYVGGKFSGEDKESAYQLSWMLMDITDGVAVATVANLSESVEAKQLVAGRNGRDVETNLGINGQLSGVGGIIVDNAILDPKIRKIIGSIQRTADADSLDLNEINRVYSIVESLDLEGKVDENEATMVLAYLTSIAGAEKEELSKADAVRQQAEIARNNAFDAQAEQARRQNELNAVLEETSKVVFYDTVISHSEPVSVPGAIWSLEPPVDYVGTKADWNFFLGDVAGMHNKTFKRKAILSNARDLAHAYFDPEYPKVIERSLASLYDDRRSGFRDALMVVAQDLFVETITEEVDGKLVIRKITDEEIRAERKGQFVMNYDIPGANSAGGELMRDVGRMAYLRRAAEILNSNNNPPKDIEFVQLQVSLALNFLELGGSFDAGDHRRKCPDDTVEAVRTVCRPGYKYGDKTEGGEVFAASWSGFFKERFADEIAAEMAREKRMAGANWDEEIAKRTENELLVRMARRMNIIPTVLCESVLDKEFVVGYDAQGHEIKMSLGRAMQSGTDIILNTKKVQNEESVGNVIFSIGKNLENAVVFWDIFSGKEKLTFKGQLTEIDTVIKELTAPLNNAYDFLKGKGLVNINMLYGAIGGAAGLVPSEPIVLDVALDPSRGQTYSFICESILSQLPTLTASELSELRAKLNVDHFCAPYLKLWWINSKDGLLKPKQRESWRRVLQNKPETWWEKAYRRKS